MIHTDMPNKKIHQGRNIKRFREMLGIKQEALAFELGEDWNQKKISLLEQKESVEKDILEQVAKILKLPIEAIENFDEEQAVNVIANTYSFQDFKDNAVASGFSYQPSFNPIDKMVDLYERMLQQQKEMIEKLEKLIEGK
ncbi:transcriptional regulator [Elizabethkingia meningoseptica]|uniref:helix-turn-helix domain-containing protein n=1 Tax=Elizabethkingia meningoseptica TaxID=238 RepID=UPI0008A9D48C|nr:helix-turn-helix transcriptional regulator [Elizabethkingia meningoseptica]MDE5448872.1 helix-turn-helix domain-containing protein [Elizabethkingia meningoseptica]MDE5470867.1 helix-turn-helix domain-containing protein [Elizabethkingia meningoseptica]MDE5519671.1 helix-turn-helix domain-containing protein [Elizabethkingia meningoseptica]MDE5524508.1 helix-turn-helix domain-containing protein [Elizabethkingia meningoseptica]MDE5524672.1 helix-turn-helix domain-containing protein [Elizabethki